MPKHERVQNHTITASRVCPVQEQEKLLRLVAFAPAVHKFAPAVLVPMLLALEALATVPATQRFAPVALAPTTPKSRFVPFAPACA